MELIWTNPAVSDLKEFRNYTKMVHPNDYISNLVKSVNLLTEQPYLGKIYSYINGIIVRQLIHEQHRIFYVNYSFTEAYFSRNILKNFYARKVAKPHFSSRRFEFPNIIRKSQK